MKFNKEYNLWVSKNGLVFRVKQDKLVLLPTYVLPTGYEEVCFYYKGNRSKHKTLHRLVWETFNGEIPEGLQVDHINGIKTDNRIENLQLLTQLDNTRKSNCNTHRKLNKGYSDFGKKFAEHFGYSYTVNNNLYSKEYRWFKRHNNVCRWEVE